MDNAHRIAEAARASLSSFCIEECRAFCCRKGFLVVPDMQARPILSAMDEKSKIERTKQSQGMISISLKGDCPALKSNMCSVYKERPGICRDYPLFLEGDLLKVSSYCTGFLEGRLYPYIREILALGYRMAHANPYAGLDFSIDLKREDPNDQLIKGPDPAAT